MFALDKLPRSMEKASPAAHAFVNAAPVKPPQGKDADVQVARVVVAMHDLDKQAQLHANAAAGVVGSEAAEEAAKAAAKAAKVAAKAAATKKKGAKGTTVAATGPMAEAQQMSDAILGMKVKASEFIEKLENYPVARSTSEALIQMKEELSVFHTAILEKINSKSNCAEDYVGAKKRWEARRVQDQSLINYARSSYGNLTRVPKPKKPKATPKKAGNAVGEKDGAEEDDLDDSDEE